ncbi:hypothetical protein KUCAC02_005641 [Chaenocephalus aceratus]|uniref:Uncharacterized protein n=1 Tax=Chaenocephalus aceratus TaxID=36190 RepID=A0ACB9WP83_CHAAC|nr:hypothetical protein KUCAC02_005641 [Chaenocephalus aceratus]
MLFLELQLSLSGPDVSSSPAPLLSSLSLSPLRPYLIVCLFSLAAPSFRSQAGGGRWKRSLRHILSTLKAEGQRRFLLSTGPRGST